MDNIEELGMNSVELQGRIQDIYVGRQVTIITLAVREMNAKKPKFNFPQIVFNSSERGLVENYKKNDFVNITGCIKVRGRRTPEGNSYFEQYVRGYLIYPVKTEMSEKFKKDLGGQYEYKNEVLIEGKVIGANDKNGVLNLLIRPKDEKFNIWCSSFTYNPSSRKNELVIGNDICVKCEIQTVRKQKDGEKARFYENLIVKYMSAPKGLTSE